MKWRKLRTTSQQIIQTSDICSLELQVFAVLQRHPQLLRLLEDVKVNQLRPPPTPGWPALPNFTETRSAHSAMIDAISWAIWCTFSPRWYDSVWSCVNNLYLSEFHHNSQENFSHKLGPSCPNSILIQLRWRCHACLPSCYSFEVTSSNVSSCDILSSKTATVHSPELGPNCYILEFLHFAGSISQHFSLHFSAQLGTSGNFPNPFQPGSSNVFGQIQQWQHFQRLPGNVQGSTGRGQGEDIPCPGQSKQGQGLKLWSSHQIDR